MRALLITVLAAVVTPVPTEPPAAEQCVVVDGARVGMLPLSVQVGARSVTFSEWMSKDVGGAELVGFRAHADGQLRVEVIAGDETFVGSSTEWRSPHGVVGPRAAGIRSIRLCAH